MATQSLEHHLEVLPAMLNLVLVQTGKTLRDPDFHNPQNASLTRRRISEFYPAANEEFHNALDAIEVEIIQAKAVMERDLSRIRKRRAERDRLSNEAKVANPSELPHSSAENGTNHLALKEPEKPSEDQPEKRGLDQDTVMLDAANHTNGQALGIAKSNHPPKADGKDQAIKSLDGMPQDSQNTTGLAISMPMGPTLKDPEIVTDITNGTIDNPELTEDLTITANAPPEQAKNNDDFDFESMFNDPGLMPQDGAIDLNFDFTTNENEAQNILGDSSMDGLTLTNEDLAKAIPATNEDLDSLLPGLDNYVNASGETSANNPATNNTAPAPDAVQENQNSDATALANTTAAAEPALDEPSFDDFFNPADFNTSDVTANNDSNLLGDGQFEEFEEFNDDWFKM